MANRRCIDVRMVGSYVFYEMSKGAQALYLALIAHADDDGVVEAGYVLRASKGKKTALTELINNGFVGMLEPCNNIVYVAHWHEFNTLDKRYGRPSIYRETLLKQFPNTKVLEFKGSNDDKPTSNTCESEDSTSHSSPTEPKGSSKSSQDNTDAPEALDRQTTNKLLTDMDLSVSDFTELEPLANVIFSFKRWCPDTSKILAERFIKINIGHINTWLDNSVKWNVAKWKTQLTGFIVMERTEPDYAEWYETEGKALEEQEARNKQWEEWGKNYHGGVLCFCDAESFARYVMHGDEDGGKWYSENDEEMCKLLSDYFTEVELVKLYKTALSGSACDEYIGFGKLDAWGLAQDIHDEWIKDDDDFKDKVSSFKNYLRDYPDGEDDDRECPTEGNDVDDADKDDGWTLPFS